MLNFTIDSDIQKAVTKLGAFSDRRFKATIATALTRTAKETRDAVKAELPSQIQGGATAFTMRALRFRGATAATLEAAVFFDGPGGRVGRYIARISQGGRRAPKGFEKLLQSKGLMPAGFAAVPGPAARLDSQGNQSAQIRQLLTQITKPGATPSQKRRNAAKAGGEYFALPNGRGKLPPGLYLRQGDRVSAVLLYVVAATYGKAYPFAETARRAAMRAFPAQFERALSESMNRVTAAQA